MERVSAAEKAAIGSKGEKKGHRSKKDKGKRKGKKDKAQGHGGDGDGSIQSDDENHSVEIEQAEILAEMAEKTCLEHTEDIMSKSDVKEHSKKKKKDKEADTISQKQILDANDESVGSGYLKRSMGKGEHDSMWKKGKQKHQDAETSLNGSCDDQIISRGDKKKRRKEHSDTLEEGNEADMSKMGQKTEGKKKRRNERDNVGVDLSQKIPSGNGNNCNKEEQASKDGSGYLERSMGEGEQDSMSKKGKQKHQDGETSLHRSCGDQIISSGDKKKKRKERSDTLEESNEADMSMIGQKTGGKKKRRKERDNVVVDLSQNIPAGNGNSCNKEEKASKDGSGYLERSMGEGEQDSMSKKGKQKHQDAETSLHRSCDDQIISSGDKKKKRKERSDTEESNEADMSMIGQKMGGKKKRRKERDNVVVDLSQSIPAGNGNSCTKEEKPSKDDKDGGKSKKVNVAHGKDKGKRVSFTDDVEVFKLDGGDGSGDSGLVHGQRFTHEEDVKLMEAIQKYSEINQLGEKGLEMIRECKKYPETRGCWAEIAKSLPHRPVMAVYKRARILLYRSDERKWTPEEYEIVRRFVEKNGTNWKGLANELGKSEIHVKDTWRRMKPKNLKKGAWTQDEYQNLFDLVNLDLRVKAHQKIAPTHRQLRDNISWEAISEKLTTRNNKDCCLKWYQQLASPLVKEGIWADTDDYLLMEALQKGDAVCFEDVDWDRLLDHRSGELCRQRWNQMVRMIGDHREKPFIEQVEVLARRYCPEMLDYRKPDASDLMPDELAGESDASDLSPDELAGESDS